MRVIIFLTLLILAFGCGSTKNMKMKPGQLNGTWSPTSQEMAGKQFPVALYEKQKLIISDKMYTVIAESVDKGEITFNGNKMDIYGKEGVNSGKHFTAIYKYENNLLTVCYNLAGDNYPTAFETKGKPLFFLSVFKKDL